MQPGMLVSLDTIANSIPLLLFLSQLIHFQTNAYNQLVKLISSIKGGLRSHSRVILLHQ